MAEPFLGQTMIVAFNFPPKGWAFCNGQLMAINQNQALFALLGTTFGGDGRTTFALPDLRGRAPIHMSGAHPLGERAGTEAITLLETQLPTHTHTVRARSDGGNQGGPGGNGWAREVTNQNATYSDALPNATMSAQAIGTAGQNQPHNNVQPFLALNFIIALQGIFPSRN